MRTIHSLVPVAALLAAGLTAQRTFTSPDGYESIEGSPVATKQHPLGPSFWTSRWQYVDGGQRGLFPRTIHKLEMRRDGGTLSVHAPQTTADLGILMAHADARSLSTTFSSNYKTAPVVVFAPRTVSLPNLSSPPVQIPAPWSIAFPFDTAFAFDGKQDLLWEFVVLRAQLASDYYLDVVVGGNVPGLGTVSAGTTGCTTPNGKFVMAGFGPQTSLSGTTTLGFTATAAPASVSAWLALGLTDPALAGVFCDQICSSAEIAVPFTTNALGEIGAAANPLTVSFGCPGTIAIHGQMVALDASQPLGGVALSNCVRWVVVGYAPLASVTLLYHGTYFGSDTGSWGQYGAPIVRWSY